MTCFILWCTKGARSAHLGGGVGTVPIVLVEIIIILNFECSFEDFNILENSLKLAQTSDVVKNLTFLWVLEWAWPNDPL